MTMTAKWYNDDAFWSGLYNVMFPPARFAAADSEIASVLALAGCTGGRVLDLCCGPGRHALALARRGFQVTAVDNSPFLLAKARAAAAEAHLTIEFIRQDMRRFVRPDTFDVAINLFTSFGFFDDREDDQLVLTHLAQSLKPGAPLVMDLIGKEIMARTFQATTSVQLEDGAVLIQRHEIFDDWSKIRNEWFLIKGATATSFSFHHTIYSGRELKDRLQTAGFSTVTLHGDFHGAPYGLSAKRLVAVATR